MKTLRTMLVCAAALALARGAFALTITARAIPNEKYGGECVAISASVEGGGAETLTMYYKKSTESNWANAESQALLKRSTNYFTGFLPAVGATTTYDWYVTDGDEISSTQQTTVTFASNTLDYNRFHNGAKYNATTDPYGWQQQGSSSNFVAATPAGTSEWKANGVVWVNANGFGQTYVDTSIEMSFPVLYFQNIPASALPYIRSPKLEGGVGTIDFRSRLAATSIRSSAIALQVAYTDEEPAESNWVTVATYTYGTDNGSVFSRVHHEVLNDPAITYVRIFRVQHNLRSSQISAGRLAIDNICITRPPAEVGISHKLENPGYPSQKDDVLIRCAVTNVVEATPATNRAVSAWFKYVAKDDDDPAASTSAWTKVEMAYKGREAGEGGRDWYEGTIPAQRTGYVWYYFEVEFDGYDYGVNPLTGARETLSPMYWDSNSGVETTSCDVPSAGARYQVRPYRSRYSRIAFDPTDRSIIEGLGGRDGLTLVDDETWQVVVPVAGYTVVSNFFRGYDYYEDDADAYSTNVVTWGENNPDSLSDPTLAGYLESSLYTNVTGRLVALNEKEYTGFYLYRFQSNDKDAAAATGPDGDRRFDYIVKKAVYQDFDEWTASQDYYETSLGGLPTTTYAEDFDGNDKEVKAGSVASPSAWRVDEYSDDDVKRERFEDEDPEDAFNPEVHTTQGFRRMSSRVLEDRKLGTGTSASANRSLAFQLHGKIENGNWVTKDTRSITEGLRNIEFQARASVDDDNFAIYKGGTGWTLPMFISSKWHLADLSPSKPYFSYILLYQPQYSYLAEEAPATWYELRVIKDDCTTADDNTATFELHRRDSSGRDTLCCAAQKKSGSNYTLVNDEASNMNIHLSKDNQNRLVVKINVRGGNPTTSGGTNGADVTLTATSMTGANLDTTVLDAGGTVGFGVFDAVPVVSTLTVGTTYGGTDLLASISEANWSHGGNREDGHGYRWTFPGGNTITRLVPEQTIGVYINDCLGNVNESLGAPYATKTISSLSMSNLTVEVKQYGRKFVTLRYDGGDGGAVIDDLWLHPWRAKTRHQTTGTAWTDYLQWTTREQQAEWLNCVESNRTTGVKTSVKNSWAILEGWIEPAGAFATAVTFERSRANTNLVQGIVTPVMTNGIGSITFSYAVSGGKVVYGVERTDEDQAEAVANGGSWTPVAVFANEAGASGNRYVKVGEYFEGRIRVRVYGAGDTADLLTLNPDCGYDPSWGATDPAAKITIDNLRAKDYPRDVNDNAWHAYNLLITDIANEGLIYNNSGKSCFLNNSQSDGAYPGVSYPDDDPYLESPPLVGVGVGEIAFQYRIVPETGSGDGHVVVKVAPSRDTPIAEWKTITNVVVSADGTAFVKFDNDKIFDEDDFVVRFYNSSAAGTPRVVIDNVLVTAPARPSFEFEYVHLSPVQPLVGSNTVVEAKIMREILNPKNIRIFCSFHKYDSANDTWGYRNWFDPLDSANRVELLLVGDKLYRTSGGIPGDFDIDDIVEFVVWGVHSEIDWEHGEPPIVQGLDTFANPAWYRTFNEQDEVIEVCDKNEEKASEGWSPYFWVYSCPPGTFFVNEIKNWRTASADRGEVEFIEFAGHAGADIGGWRFATIGNSEDDFDYTVPAGTTVRGERGTGGWGFFMWADSCADTELGIRVDAEFPYSEDPDDTQLGTYGGILVYRSNDMIEHMVSYGTASRVSGGSWDYFDYAGRKSSGEYSLSLSVPDNAEDNYTGAVYSNFTWKVLAQTPQAVNLDQEFEPAGEDEEPLSLTLFAPNGTEITNASQRAWVASFASGGEITSANIDAVQAAIDGNTQQEFEDAYLLNMDYGKTRTHSLRITRVGVDATNMTATATLTRTENGNDVGNREINGRLAIIGQETLDGEELEVEGEDVEVTNRSFQSGDEVTIKFMRLRIVDPE